MKSTLIVAARLAVVWLVLIVGQMAGGMIGQALTRATVPAMQPDGLLGPFAATAVVAGLFAMVLSLMASSMRGSLAVRFAALFALVYGVETLLSLIEAIYFNDYVHLSNALLALLAVSNGVKAALGALAAALLWPARPDPAERFTGLVWRIPAIIPLYIVFYFGAGALIAWQSADVRAYYAQGFDIDEGQLALLQVGRGLIWALLALLAVSALTGPPRRRALLTGLAFAVFMAATLLYPNPLMPWPVRRMHMLEIAVSNLLFGVSAALILLGGRKRNGITAS